VAYDEPLARPHACEMDFTGKPLKGMIYVDAKGIRAQTDLCARVGRGVAFAASLPPK